MTNAQTIKTPAGDEMVVLPRADYDALLARLAELEEDMADIAAYDAAMLAGSGDPGRQIPDDTLKGALIRSARKAAGMTQEALAAALGLQQGFVSDLESGRRRGSPETIDKLAATLELSNEAVAALKA